MGIDFTPKDQELNPMERKAFDAMDPQDKSEFCRRGGKIYFEPEKKELSTMVSPGSGKSLTREEWDRMSAHERTAFIEGRGAQ